MAKKEKLNETVGKNSKEVWRSTHSDFAFIFSFILSLSPSAFAVVLLTLVVWGTVMGLLVESEKSKDWSVSLYSQT